MVLIGSASPPASSCNPHNLPDLARHLQTHGILQSSRHARNRQHGAFSVRLSSLYPLDSKVTLASYNFNLPGFANLPNFLQSIQHFNPTDSTCTNWHHMRGLSRFDELRQHPTEMAIFQAVMTANAESKMSWTDLFPTQQLINARRPGIPLLVDVGGGAGHDIERLCKRMLHSESGALVLQDLEPVIEKATVDESVRTMVHDFFDEQPIKGISRSNQCRSICDRG